MVPMSSRRVVFAAAGCLLLAGCAGAPADEPPVVHITQAAQPSPVRPLAQVLPGADDLAAALGAAGYPGQVVTGGADMLLAGVGEAEATPAECVGPTRQLQKVVYQQFPVQSVATQSWVGGGADGPAYSAFVGAVQFATADDAAAFFAASAQRWRRCNGQTVVSHQPAAAVSRITDVALGDGVLSAVVLQSSGGTVAGPLQRALGLAGDCVVEVELTDMRPGAPGAVGALGVANLMRAKVEAS